MMKARLFTNSMRSGNIARDFIHLALEHQNSAPPDARSGAKAARVILESFEGQDRTLSADSVVPIKPLVKVLTESLQGTRNLTTDADGRMDGARLFRGCKVRLRGIPERQFIIRDIYWDYGEVRVKEVGGETTFYLVPWDCLEIIPEQKR